MFNAKIKKIPKKILRSNVLENNNNQSQIFDVLKNNFGDSYIIIYDYMCESNELYEMYINKASPSELIYLKFCNIIPLIEFNTIIKYRYHGKKIINPCNLSLYIDNLTHSKDYKYVSALVRFYFITNNQIFKDYIKNIYNTLTYSEYIYITKYFEHQHIIKYVNDPIMIDIYNDIKLDFINFIRDDRYIEKSKNFINFFEKAQLTDKNINNFINKLTDHEYKLLELYRTKMYKNITSIYWLIYKINDVFDELSYNEFIKNCIYTKYNYIDDYINNRNLKLSLILNKFDDEFIINNIEIIIDNKIYCKNQFLDHAIINMIEKFMKFSRDDYILKVKKLFTIFIIYNIDSKYIKNLNKKKLIHIMDIDELFEYNINNFCTLFIDNNTINGKLIVIDFILKNLNTYNINNQFENSIIYFLDRYYNLIDYSSVSKFSDLILKYNNTRAIRILSKYYVE